MFYDLRYSFMRKNINRRQNIRCQTSATKRCSPLLCRLPSLTINTPDMQNPTSTNTKVTYVCIDRLFQLCTQQLSSDMASCLFTQLCAQDSFYTFMDTRPSLEYLELHCFMKNIKLPDAFDDPLCAVIARIEFVQRTEPRSVGFDPG